MNNSKRFNHTSPRKRQHKKTPKKSRGCGWLADLIAIFALITLVAVAIFL